MRKTLFIWVLLFAKLSFAQNIILPNEKVVFSFETQNNKTVMLAKDSADNYIVYRFGTKNKTELEYPDKTKASWNKLTYSYYLRGGGKTNEGMDLNYIYFTINNYQYVIYDTYFSVGNKTEIGIKVIDVTTKKTTNLKGKLKTKKGDPIIRE